MSVQMGNTIDNTGTFPRPGPNVGNTSLTRTTEGSTTTVAGSTSERHVSFSDSVTLLQRLQSQVESEPVVDNARVDAARTAIEDGSYQIDHNKIAGLLVDFERELP